MTTETFRPCAVTLTHCGISATGDAFPEAVALLFHELWNEMVEPSETEPFHIEMRAGQEIVQGDLTALRSGGRDARDPGAKYQPWPTSIHKDLRRAYARYYELMTRLEGTFDGICADLIQKSRRAQMEILRAGGDL